MCRPDVLDPDGMLRVRGIRLVDDQQPPERVRPAPGVEHGSGPVEALLSRLSAPPADTEGDTAPDGNRCSAGDPAGGYMS